MSLNIKCPAGLSYQTIITDDSGAGDHQSIEELLMSKADGEKNHLHVLIREHLQNALDAWDEKTDKQGDKKLIFRVSRKTFNKEALKIDDLNDQVFKDCLRYLRSKPNHEKIKFYQKLNEISNKLDIKSTQMWATIIEDNGCGLSGNLEGPHGFSRINRLGEEQENYTSVKILSEGGETTKYDKQRGSHGVGKLSAWLNNKMRTVYYLTTFKNRSFFIGKTKLSSYMNESGHQLSSNVFFGRKGSGSLENETPDWYELTKDDSVFKNHFRSIQNDGLTTIIPFDKIDDDKDKEYVLEICYAVIQSFSMLFEEDKLEVAVSDEYSGEEIVISSKNYKEIYKKCESLKYIQANEVDLHNYHLIKPLVLDKGRRDYELKIKVNEKYKGIAKFRVYYNQALSENISKMKNPKADFKKTFRLLRRGMLIRSYHRPHHKVSDPSVTGFIFFEGEKNKKTGQVLLNEIIQKAEGQSHDTIEEGRWKEHVQYFQDFPSVRLIKENLLRPISKKIREIVEELSEFSVDENDGFDVRIDFGKGEENRDVPSFKRRLMLGNEYKKGGAHDESNSDQNGGGGGRKDEGVSPGGAGLGDLKIKRFRVGPPNPPGPEPVPRPPINVPEWVDEGLEDGSRRRELSKVSVLQKIDSKKQNSHTYMMRFDAVESKINIGLSQESTITDGYLSFRLKEVFVNDKPFSGFKTKKNHRGETTSYSLEGVVPNDKVVDLKLVVEEPAVTESKFKVNIS